MSAVPNSPFISHLDYWYLENSDKSEFCFAQNNSISTYLSAE